MTVLCIILQGNKTEESKDSLEICYFIINEKQ